MNYYLHGSRVGPKWGLSMLVSNDIDSGHVGSTYCVLGQVLKILPVSSHLILTRPLQRS